MINCVRPDNKKKGVLLPIFSLPSPYGIGCFSQEARDFVDWLAETGHRYWQILPLNPTGCADSPYQPLSSFAGNPYFIDPQQLWEQGLITAEELAGFDFGSDPARVDYEALHADRMGMLRLAYERFARKLQAAGDARESDAARDVRESETAGDVWDSEAKRDTAMTCPAALDSTGTAAPTYDAAASSSEPPAADAAKMAYQQFLRGNAAWLEDYALFMTLRERFGRETSWESWPQPLRHRETTAIEEVQTAHAETIDFHRWTQYEFARQWEALKAYANAAGVEIIGDMPVYVSYDSSDCWANPGQFQLDEDLLPARIAGVPPDDFAAEGQLWGNPLFDWEAMRGDGYLWWRARIQRSFQLYDVIRLDHFRGYEAYYSCAADAENAMDGIWHPGPGMDLFQRLEATLPGVCDEVHDFDAGGAQIAVSDAKTRAPGVQEETLETGKKLQVTDAAPTTMKVDVDAPDAAEAPLRFIAEDLGHLTEGVYRLLAETGFPGMKVLQFAFDGDPANPYLPENFGENCVVYTGTHDNDTTAGWFRSLDQTARAGILQYLGYTGEEAWWFVLEADAAVKRGEALGVPHGAGTIDMVWAATKNAVGASKTEACTTTCACEAETKAGSGDAPHAIQPPQSVQPGRVPCAPGPDGRIPDPALIAADSLVSKALESKAKLAIIPLQDYLHLGSEARVNTPGTIVDNWQWRI